MLHFLKELQKHDSGLHEKHRTNLSLTRYSIPDLV